MSKAFTKETEPEEPDREPVPAGGKNYVTPKGLKLLQDELHALSRVERPKVVETVSWAASNGDRSENGDYIYGKRRLREIDRRMRFLRPLPFSRSGSPDLLRSSMLSYVGGEASFLTNRPGE